MAEWGIKRRSQTWSVIFLLLVMMMVVLLVKQIPCKGPHAYEFRDSVTSQSLVLQTKSCRGPNGAGVEAGCSAAVMSKIHRSGQKPGRSVPSHVANRSFRGMWRASRVSVRLVRSTSHFQQTLLKSTEALTVVLPPTHTSYVHSSPFK